MKTWEPLLPGPVWKIAAGLLLASWRNAPLMGPPPPGGALMKAGLSSVTVIVDGWPLYTDVGLTVTLWTWPVVMVSWVMTFAPSAAERLTIVVVVPWTALFRSCADV